MVDEKKLPRCSAGLLTFNSTEAGNGGLCFVCVTAFWSNPVLIQGSQVSF